MNDAPLIDTAAAARLLALSTFTLVAWRRRNLGPPFIRVGTKKIRYDRADIAVWINRCRSVPQYDAPPQGF